MPTYAYRCTACTHRFDAFQRMTDDPLTECPTCGGSVKRLIQNVPIVFKGSGWYVTDSRKSSGSAAADTGSTSADGAKPAEKTKGEDGPKPAEKAKSAKNEPAAVAAD